MPKRKNANLTEAQIIEKKRISDRAKVKKYQDKMNIMKTMVDDEEFKIYKNFAEKKNISIAQLIKDSLREYVKNNK